MATDTDFNFFLRNRNPYKKTLVGGGIGDQSPGWGSSVYSGWGDVVNGTNWQNQQIAQRNAAQAGAPTSIGGPASNPNPFTTLRNAKNPGIDAAIAGAIGEVSSIRGPQRDTIISTTKSRDLGDRLSKEFHNFDLDRDGNRSTLADFTNNFLAAGQQAKENTTQEIGSVGEFFDGSVRNELDRLSGARRVATAGALTPAIQAVLRGRNMGALLGGNDSFLDQQVLDRVGGLSRAAAIDNADQLRQNYLYEREGQNRLLGTRANLLDRNLMRDLVPMQVGQAANAADLQRLYGIGAAEAANTNYRVTNPQTELATRLGLIGEASRIDLGNTFYGLQKPYEPSISGFVGGGVGTGGGYGGDFGGYGPAADAILAQGGVQPGFGAPRPVPGSVASPQWGRLPAEMQAQVANQGFDFGFNGAASQAGMPGTTFIANGRQYIRNADGSASPVGADMLTNDQRFYDTPGFPGVRPPTGDPNFPAGRYFQSNIPAYEGFDSIPLDFFGGAA